MKTCTLQQLSKSITSGATPFRGNPEFWLNGTIPWLKTEQLGERNIYNTNEKITEKALSKTSVRLNPVNTISIAMYGEGKTRGNVSIIRKEMATNQACCNVVLDPTLADSGYVYYFLKNQYQNLRALSSGVRKNLNSSDIKNFTIILPATITHQEKISQVLAVLDDKIELNNQINEELEAMAKLLYDYWFVQFDFPITAAQAAAMGKPRLEGKPYRASGGKMIYNDALNREIPDGWDILRVGDVLAKELRTKNILSSEIVDKGQIPVIDQGSTFICGYTDNEESKINETPKIVFGDHTRILKFINFPFARGADGTQILTSREDRLPQHLFFYQLLNIDLSSYGYARHFKFLKDQKVVLPDLVTASAFEEYAASLYTKIKNNIFQNQELTELRDWLLPMLMNGQVTVK